MKTVIGMKDHFFMILSLTRVRYLVERIYQKLLDLAAASQPAPQPARTA
jgi:hypothetical protein